MTLVSLNEALGTSYNCASSWQNGGGDSTPFETSFSHLHDKRNSNVFFELWNLKNNGRSAMKIAKYLITFRGRWWSTISVHALNHAHPVNTYFAGKNPVKNLCARFGARTTFLSTNFQSMKWVAKYFLYFWCYASWDGLMLTIDLRIRLRTGT